MSYLLDTNACIQHLRHGTSSSIAEKLASVSPSDVFVCSIVVAELLFGAHHSRQTIPALAAVRSFLSHFVSVPFDDRAAEIYGVIRARLAAAGNVIGPNDLLIASIAVAHGMTLVTHNTAEFRRITELAVEDWQVPPSL